MTSIFLVELQDSDGERSDQDLVVDEPNGVSRYFIEM